MKRLTLRDRQFEMAANVDGDAASAHHRRRQGAEFELRLLEVAQLSHEALRVERPAFAASAVPDPDPLQPAGMLFPAELDPSLEMVAGEPLVIDRGHVLP